MSNEPEKQRPVRPEDCLPSTIVLGPADSRAFVAAMLDLPPVNNRMRDGVRRYRAIVEARGR